MNKQNNKIQPEIENLSIEEIDVEELENRIELAVATAALWDCTKCNPKLAAPK